MHRVDTLPNLTLARIAGSGGGARTVVFCLLASLAGSTMAATLTGRAVLPAVTFAPGPTSGRLIGPGPFNGIIPPFPDKQPIQGFSGALDRGDGTFEVMADNGFGAKADSADFHLRVYTVRPNFATGSGGSANVTVERFVELTDPERRSGFPIQNENLLGRMLTGADFDIESIQRGRDGSLWIGDEFGPFVLHVAASGDLLDAPFPTPGVQSDSNPFIPAGTGNLPNSRGFEGMAISPDGRFLYPMLEGALKTDPDPKLTLRIFEFDTVAKAFTGRLWRYRLEDPSNALGDLQAINGHELLVIERDGAQGPAAALKKVFKIELSQTDSEGFVSKAEVLDLLDIADPNGISTSAPLPRPGDFGLGDRFRFPFVTIEDVVVLSPAELLVINDNDFPFSAGRNPSLSDDNEFIRVLLDDALNVNPEVLVRPPLLTARAELLSAAHAALEGAVEDAGASGMLALAAIQRARELFRVYAPKKLEKRLDRLRKALRLTRAALQKAELGRRSGPRATSSKPGAWSAMPCPPSKSGVPPLATSKSRARSASIAGSPGSVSRLPLPRSKVPTGGDSCQNQYPSKNAV